MALSAENFSDTQFDYSQELAPRVWVEVLGSDALGMRAIYWQFDHAAGTAVGQPPANGFGSIIPPDFGNIDLSTTVPGSQFTANSDINAYTIDLELTKAMNWGRCGFLTAFGLRYAEIQQSYTGELQNEMNVTQGTVNFRHSVNGIGPTLAMRSERPLTRQLGLFGTARGAVLFGDGDTLLTAVEDLDLDDQLTTTQTTTRDDLLPIGELQCGIQWTPGCIGVWHPYLHVALEGQVWGGVGDASSEDGNLGFFGFNVALGFDL